MDQMACTGLTGIDTPHLDRLAKEGVCSTRAYCASPTCTPSRVSLLTGTFPSIHGAYAIGVTADPFPRPLLPEALKAAGYTTALVGKHHFVQRYREDAHLGARSHDDLDYFRQWNGPWLGFDTVYASSGHTTLENPREHYRVWLQERSPGYEKWFPELGGEAPEYGAWDLPAELSDSAFVADRCQHLIRERQNEPWFCWASFQDPHGPYVCPREWYDRVDPQTMPLPYPGYREGEFDNRPAFYKKIHQSNEPWGKKTFRIDDQELGATYGHAGYDAHEREIMRAEVGMIGMLDHYLGTLLETLEATGQLENTLILFTSDHGFMHGHHGLWGKGIAAYEDCQKVPFIAWGPGLVQPKGLVDGLVSLIDLPRTLVAAAGAEPSQGMQGKDLLPWLKGETDNPRRDVRIEFRTSQNGPRQTTLVTDRHKLIVYDTPDEGELYDLCEDPDQYRNLWNDPSAQILKGTLCHQLTQNHLHEQGAVHDRTTFA
jgi:uncharacterized sulfatase